MNREVKRSAKDDKRRWLNRLADEAQHTVNVHNMRDTYRIVKQLCKAGSQGNHLVRAMDGRLLANIEEQAERWSEHLEDVLNKALSLKDNSS